MGFDTNIVRAVIHPGIGVARVGNSVDDFYIGPEVLQPLPMPPGFIRDDHGALKRQAARFRIYGYNAAGEVVREITAADATIEWEVELANTKAAWYQFQIALDISEAAAAEPSLLRNAEIKDRDSLAIRPGPRRIQGCLQQGTEFRFDSGTFCGMPVYLGEIRTDEVGRLLVLGGHGKSSSVEGKPATTFANNDGWHDDISDGPVRAKLVMSGVAITVDSAWIVVAPPNYGPELKSVRTMRDLLEDVYVRSGMVSFPLWVSFSKHIFPILVRQSALQWANKGFAAQFGWGGAACADNADWIAKLNSNGDTYRELRRQVANAFRQFDRDGTSPQPWPWLYGDAMDLPPANTPRQYSSLTDTQLRMLDIWADGQFLSDWNPSIRTLADLSSIPLIDQPATLDHAAMEACVADAFHPGCELTWPMRHGTLFRGPFRIREAEHSLSLYGAQLTSATALSVGGPLYGQAAGDLTRWMAVPWQTDTASCRSGYYAGYGPRYDPYVPSFWPARVPNQVLSEEAYQRVMDTSVPRGERLAAFHGREKWFRTLNAAGYDAEMNRMISNFGDMGVLELRPGVLGDADFPPVMQVENRIEPSATTASAQAADRIEPFDAQNERQIQIQINPETPR